MEVWKHKETCLPVVVTDQGVSKALTEAAQFSLASYSMTGREKLIRWLRRYLGSVGLEPTEFADQEAKDASMAMESFLKDHGCSFSRMTGTAYRDGMMKVTRSGQDHTEISIFLNAMLDFYERLEELGARTKSNPLMLKGYGKKDIAERRKIDARREANKRFYVFRGLKYEVVNETPYVPKRQDPRRPRTLILGYVEQGDWPPEVVVLMMVLADSGCRIAELPELTAWDWYEGSFGPCIRAPNKKSSGKRVKDLVLTDETLESLELLFDKGPPQYAGHGGMRGLKSLVGEPGFEKRLKKISLFKRADGSLYSTWSLRNTYFAKAVDAMAPGGVKVEQVSGEWKKATPHVLRAARITDEVNRLDNLYPDHDDFSAALIEFADFMHCGVENIFRYAAEALRQRQIRLRREMLKENADSVRERLSLGNEPSETAAIIERMGGCLAR